MFFKFLLVFFQREFREKRNLNWKYRFTCNSRSDTVYAVRKNYQNLVGVFGLKKKNSPKYRDSLTKTRTAAAANCRRDPAVFDWPGPPRVHGTATSASATCRRARHPRTFDNDRPRSPIPPTLATATVFSTRLYCVLLFRLFIFFNKLLFLFLFTKSPTRHTLSVDNRWSIKHRRMSTEFAFTVNWHFNEHLKPIDNISARVKNKQCTFREGGRMVFLTART